MSMSIDEYLSITPKHAQAVFGFPEFEVGIAYIYKPGSRWVAIKDPDLGFMWIPIGSDAPRSGCWKERADNLAARVRALEAELSERAVQ